MFHKTETLRRNLPTFDLEFLLKNLSTITVKNKYKNDIKLLKNHSPVECHILKITWSKIFKILFTSDLLREGELRTFALA